MSHYFCLKQHYTYRIGRLIEAEPSNERKLERRASADANEESEDARRRIRRLSCISPSGSCYKFGNCMPHMGIWSRITKAGSPGFFLPSCAVELHDKSLQRHRRRGSKSCVPPSHQKIGSSRLHDLHISGALCLTVPRLADAAA